MGVRSDQVLELVSGWKAVKLVLKCAFFGLWQMLQLSVRRLWKGHRRKLSKSCPPVELTVDSSVGVHCYIKIMGVKYHYVETGPKNGKKVLILGDAPDMGDLWVPRWSVVVRKLAETGHHVITLDLRGTGASEGGGRADLAPPRAVGELRALLLALGASESKPAVVIGFGIGGMLTWYLVHCHGAMVSKFAVVAAPHPNLYWQYPPAAFCQGSIHFIQPYPFGFYTASYRNAKSACKRLYQWPHFPESWLAEGVLQEGARWASSRARDWSGALNYVRGAAWYRIHPEHKVQARGLLVGARDNAAQLVASAQYCANPALRLVSTPSPGDKDLPGMMLDFFVGKPKPQEEIPRGLVGRVLGAVADRGRNLTARLALPANA